MSLSLQRKSYYSSFFALTSVNQQKIMSLWFFSIFEDKHRPLLERVSLDTPLYKFYKIILVISHLKLIKKLMFEFVYFFWINLWTKNRLYGKSSACNRIANLIKFVRKHEILFNWSNLKTLNFMLAFLSLKICCLANILS